MRNLILVLTLLFVHQNTALAETGTQHQSARPSKAFWIASISAMLAATSADAATSWGKQEGNPLLASASGQFGAKGVSIKAAMAAAFIIPQVLLRHHHDALQRKFITGNLLQAGVFSGLAVHNARQ